MILALCLALAFPFSQLNSLVAAPAAAQASASYAESFDWKPVVYRNHCIVSVGGRVLPMPLKLPKEITPLGTMALLSTFTRPNQLTFSIYFAESDEAKIRKWTDGFPADCPFPQNSYLPGSLHLRRRYLGGKSHLWTALASVRGSFDWASVLLQPGEHVSLADTAIYATGSDDFSVMCRRVLAADALAVSPIRSRNRYIEMEVSFHNATRKVK